MGLIGDVAGAFGISKSGILTGALKLVGVPDKMAELAGAALDISSGMTKDGFDLSKVNKGALARHALRAFGIDSPLAALGGAAALSMLPKGFLSSAGGAAGGGLNLASLAGPALGMTALGALAGQQAGIGSLLAGIAGVGGLSAGMIGSGGLNDIAGTAFGLLTGNKDSQIRQMTGMTRSNLGPGSMLASLPKPAMFEDIVMAFMIDVVKDKQKKVEDRLKNLEAEDNASNSGGNVAGQAVGAVAPGATQAAQDGNSDSRNIEFEIIKNEIQKLSQMQQAMSNVLDTMNDQAMNSIRHIKSG
jgi:hypothetical protein